ncbi:MAG: MoxR family ATPase [Gemmataceae bacterium]|nr:MoxR family ATPase [Gemmataceae bacterium]
MTAAGPGANGVALEPLAAEVRSIRTRIHAELSRVVVGLDDVIDQLLIALLAGGHVLLEGVPGVAKTTLSKAFARVLGGHYQRVQFTPDLLPSDVTGTYVLDRKTGDFVLRRGPIFCQVLLADEVNRAPAKTQSALLEAMQETQVTIEGTTLELPRPFLVLATQNPVEQEGVYRLPEAQLDRFLIRATMGYPGHDPEVAMLKLHSQPTVEVDSVLTPERVLSLQGRLPEVHCTESLLHYIVNVAEASRDHADIALGASPRAALSLLRCARARALLEGRGYVTHEDLQRLAPSVLGHRIILRPESEIEGRRVDDAIADLLAQVPVTEIVGAGPRRPGG